jgi:hypothetical protein
MTVPDWTPVAILPNVDMREPVEAEVAALVRADDERVMLLRRRQPVLDHVLGSFTDAFGRHIVPGVLLTDGDPRELFRLGGSLTSLRDAVALSVVPRARATTIVYERASENTYSNIFAFYPWMVDRYGEHLVALTSSVTAIDEWQDFAGQVTPGVAQGDLSSLAIDLPLLRVLLARWQATIGVAEPPWSDLALFRSLNMANQACMMPTAASNTTLYDVGRTIAVWVSAFEILVHPGGARSRSGRDQVIEVLDNAPWLNRRCVERTSLVPALRQNQPATMNTLASLLYARLYAVRNAFLHGNAVNPSMLKTENGHTSLSTVAAPLYRMALASFLKRTELDRPAVSSGHNELPGATIESRAPLDWIAQEVIENALRVAVDGPVDRGHRNPRQTPGAA